MFATKRGYIRRDLLDEVDTLRVPTILRLRPIPRVLNQMIDTADNPRDRALVATFINTGLRRNEALRLRVSDVDLGGRWLHVFISKSQVEDRMPLTPNLCRELVRWLKKYAADIGRPLDADDYSFPRRKPGVISYRREADGSKTKELTASTWSASTPMAHPERAVKAALAGPSLIGPPVDAWGSDWRTTTVESASSLNSDRRSVTMAPLRRLPRHRAARCMRSTSRTLSMNAS